MLRSSQYFWGILSPTLPRAFALVPALLLVVPSNVFAQQTRTQTNTQIGWQIAEDLSDAESKLFGMRHSSGATMVARFFPNSDDLERPYSLFSNYLNAICHGFRGKSPEMIASKDGYYAEVLGPMGCAIFVRRINGGVFSVALSNPSGTIPMRGTIASLEQGIFDGNAVQAQAGNAAAETSNAGVAVADPYAGRQVPRPIGLASTLSDATSGFPPMRTNEQIRWYLFPGGIAHSCDDVDPRSLTMTYEALKAEDSCDVARWRKVGSRTELLVDGDDEWEDVTDALAKPVPKGLRLDAHYVRQGGYSTYNTNVLTSGGVMFTRDGQFQAASSTGFGGNYGAVSAIGSGSSDGLSGRYELDGYIMKITNGGQTTYRYVYFSQRDGKPYGYIQFEGKLYWDE